MIQSLPKVVITEEVMREGMQIESPEISAADKIDLLNRLSRTGLKRIVVGSFVRPEYTPQMAEIEQVLDGLEPVASVTYIARVFNAKGRERAAKYTPPLTVEQRVPLLRTHLSDIFVRRNYNMTQQQEMDRWPGIIARAKNAGGTEAGIGIGAAFGSNFGDYPGDEEAYRMLQYEASLWADAGVPVTSLFLSDPMGWVMPQQLRWFLTRALDEWPAITSVRLHLHDARGLAMASTYVALEVLNERHTLELDTTVGGIGGCPYCGTGSATGMVATEDLVNLLEMLGVDTGVDMDALIEFAWRLEEVIGRPVEGKVSKAGPHPRSYDAFPANLPAVETMEDARHFRLGMAAIRSPRWPWKREFVEEAVPGAVGGR